MRIQMTVGQLARGLEARTPEFRHERWWLNVDDRRNRYCGTLFQRVSCVNALDCWAAGVGATGNAATPFIFKTTTGGETWTQQTLPNGLEYVNDLSCVSQSECRAVATTTADTGSILTTSDGRQHLEGQGNSLQLLCARTVVRCEFGLVGLLGGPIQIQVPESSCPTM